MLDLNQNPVALSPLIPREKSTNALAMPPKGGQTLKSSSTTTMAGMGFLIMKESMYLRKGVYGAPDVDGGLAEADEHEETTERRIRVDLPPKKESQFKKAVCKPLD